MERDTDGDWVLLFADSIFHRPSNGLLVYYLIKKILRFQYLAENFPSEHFSALFSLGGIPSGVANFVIDPFFNEFILNGDSMANATFGPGLSFPLIN